MRMDEGAVEAAEKRARAAERAALHAYEGASNAVESNRRALAESEQRAAAALGRLCAAKQAADRTGFIAGPDAAAQALRDLEEIRLTLEQAAEHGSLNAARYADDMQLAGDAAAAVRAARAAVQEAAAAVGAAAAEVRANSNFHLRMDAAAAEQEAAEQDAAEQEGREDD